MGPFPSYHINFLLSFSACVVIAFFVCWAPFHAQRLLNVVYMDHKWEFMEFTEFKWMNMYLYYITGCLYYFSSTVNPILYNVLSKKYRYKYQETLFPFLSVLL